jgi:D-glycero-alpha-D-manno-heptose-7-phosphate kinase
MELRELTEELIERLRDNHTASIGMALRRNWEIKKSQGDSVSNPTIDTMVDKAMFYGATGCKICGAGGGGFLLSYVPESNHAEFKTGMSNYRELKFKIDPYGARVIFNIQ